MPPEPEWLFQQSGVVPIQDGNIVLVTSRSGNRWTIPKGIIEPDLSAWESAANEAVEEAGVIGTVETAALGEYEYHKWGGTCIVLVFRMQVETLLDTWDEMDFRTRIVVSPDDAMARIHSPALQSLIRKAVTPPSNHPG